MFRGEIRVDPFIGGTNRYKLCDPTLQALHSKGLFFLNHAKKDGNFIDGHDYWLLIGDIQLDPQSAVEWGAYVHTLHQACIRLGNSEDKIHWSWNTLTGQGLTNLAYKSIAFEHTVYRLR